MHLAAKESEEFREQAYAASAHHTPAFPSSASWCENKKSLLQFAFSMFYNFLNSFLFAQNIFIYFVHMCVGVVCCLWKSEDS